MLESVRDIVSGSDSSAQFAAEVNYLSQSQREELLQQVKLPVVIPAVEGKKKKCKQHTVFPRIVSALDQ